MALSCCFFSSQLCFSPKIDRPRLASSTSCNKIIRRRCADSKMYAQQVVGKEVNQCTGWGFSRGSRNINRPKTGPTDILPRKSSVVYASWMQCTEIASGAFTLGTAAVLPFYTLMVVAPRAKFTKKVAGSNLPYMVLGALYGYLLYLSWTPDTIRFMFASRYWLPELSGIAKMFSSEMTLASAWIHLLAVDLYAARQVYDDGLENNIETRHSVSLCLLFCPIGILAHFITKSLTCNGREKEQGNPLIK